MSFIVMLDTLKPYRNQKGCQLVFRNLATVVSGSDMDRRHPSAEVMVRGNGKDELRESIVEGSGTRGTRPSRLGILVHLRQVFSLENFSGSLIREWWTKE